MNEEWINKIKVQLAIAEGQGLIEEDYVDKYLSAIEQGQKQETSRNYTINQPLDEYLYQRALRVEGDVEDYEGADDITQNIASRGMITKDDFMSGFSVQIYQAAKNGKVIIFPEDIDLMSQPVMDLEESEKATKAGEVNEDYRSIINERFKRAVITYDWKKLNETYGLENAGKPASAINKNSLTNKYLDSIDNELDYAKRQTYKSKKNYANSFVQFLDKGNDKPKTVYQTGDFGFNYNTSNEGVQAALQAFGLNKFSSNVPQQIGKRLSEIAREKGFTNSSQVTQHLRDTYGDEFVDKAGLKLYTNEYLNQAKEYGERNFSGYSAAKGKSIGMNIQRINVE